MSLSAITISVKAMHALKNGYQSMSLMIWNAHSVIHQCTKFTALLGYRLRDQDSIVRTIDERHASEQDFY
jgi:hypothetical protein